MNKMKEDYNIITLGLTKKGTDNNFYISTSNVSSKMLGAKEDENSFEKNKKVVEKELKNIDKLPKIDIVVIVNVESLKLPNGNLFLVKDFPKSINNKRNEFFDYVGNDEEMIKMIDKANTKLVNNFDKKYIVKFNSILRMHANFVVLEKIIKKDNAKASMIMIDPVSYYPYFLKKGIDLDVLYFADDTRGTRNFKSFDFAQIQHLVFENLKTHKIEKEKDFVFYGTIFQEKGNRTTDYYRFLHNLKDASLFIPLKTNGINYSRSDVTDNQLEKTKSKFSDLLQDIKTNKNYSGALKPDDLNEEISKYKYTLILKCVSFEDSLNYRPVLNSALDILPFFDPMYDPDYLQIPKSIQDKLRVNDYSDIERLIEYYNEHDDERKQLLHELKTHLKIYDYFENPDKMLEKEIKKLTGE
jgi:hypothetical protein